MTIWCSSAVATLVAVILASAPALGAELSRVNDVLYVLQPGNLPGGLREIEASGFDLVILEPSADGSTAGEWTAAELAPLRANGRILLAYLSIGEAEAYRDYFDPRWVSQPASAPPWLGPFNPLFPDNYKVRYWDPAWQRLLFGQPGAALDRILAQGFDGIYLDIIDAFDFWSETQPERSREQARRDMVALVEALARYARAQRGPNAARFLVFPQNGETVVLDDEGERDALGACFLTAIDGLGTEDVFYNELAPQDPEAVAFRSEVFGHFLAAGRLIVTTDYLWSATNASPASNAARYRDFLARSQALGLVPYAALDDRDLDEILLVPASLGTPVPQPRPGTGPGPSPSQLQARRGLALECAASRRPL